jgi:hypothetical protein
MADKELNLKTDVTVTHRRGDSHRVADIHPG